MHTPFKPARLMIAAAVLEPAVRSVHDRVNVPLSNIGGYETYELAADRFFQNVHAAPPAAFRSRGDTGAMKPSRRPSPCREAGLVPEHVLAAFFHCVHEIVRHLYPSGGAPWFECPADVVEREVCAVSGRAAGPLCERRVKDLALRQCSSYAVCPVHVREGTGPVRERWPHLAFLFTSGYTSDDRAFADVAAETVKPAANYTRVCRTISSGAGRDRFLLGDGR